MANPMTDTRNPVSERVTDPDCKHKHTDMGYGLAGGGIGIYEYCKDCGEILSKTQDTGE